LIHRTALRDCRCWAGEED